MPVGYSQQWLPAFRGGKLPLVRGPWPVSSSTYRFRDPDGSHSSAPHLDGCRSRRCIFRAEATRKWKKQKWHRNPSPSRIALVLTFLWPSSAGNRVTGEAPCKREAWGGRGAVLWSCMHFVAYDSVCSTTDLKSPDGGGGSSQHLPPLYYQRAAGWPSHP